MDNVFCYLVDMPCTVNGVTVPNDDGSYTVLINCNLNYEQQVMAYDHEISHIKNGDCYSLECVNMIEERMF